MSERKTRVMEQPVRSEDDGMNFKELFDVLEAQMATLTSSLTKLHEKHETEVRQAGKSARKSRRPRSKFSHCPGIPENNNSADLNTVDRYASAASCNTTKTASSMLFDPIEMRCQAADANHSATCTELAEFHKQGAQGSHWSHPNDPDTEMLLLEASQKSCSVSQETSAMTMYDSSPGTSNITLLPFWENDLVTLGRMDALPVVTCMMEDIFVCNRFSMATCQTDQEQEDSFMQRWMTPPSSVKSMVWELFGGLLIMFDMIIIPLQNFKLKEHNNEFDVMSKLICVYWTLDIPRQFFLMYEEMGVLEKRPVRVAGHYLKTWFVPDVAVVSYDWVDFLTGFGGSASRSWRFNSKIARVYRVLRVVRLIRVAKAWKTLAAIVDYVQSPYTLFAYKVFCLVAVVFLCVHYGACYIYAVIDWLTPTSPWILQSKSDFSTGWEQYFAAIQWSLAQAGFASTDIHPTTVLERSLAAVVAISWVFLCGYVCTELTVWTLQLRDTNLEVEQHEAKVRKFMRQRSVQSELGNRVVRFFRLNYKELVVRVMEKDIKHFKDLPVELRIHLHKAVYRTKLGKSPVFDLFDDLVLDSLCHAAMDEHHHLAEEQIFAAGEDAVRALYHECGVMNYYIGAHNRGTVVEKGVAVGKGSWVADMALWCNWKHQGGLVAVTSCTTVDLNVERFLAVIAVSENTGANLYPARYFAKAVKMKLQEVESLHDMCLDKEWLQTILEFAQRSAPVRVSRRSSNVTWFQSILSRRGSGRPHQNRISTDTNFLKCTP